MLCRDLRSSASILMLLMLCACTPLPIPIYVPGDNSKARMIFDESAVASIRPGISTRESVLLALGEPGAVAPDARWFAYAAQISEGEWKVIYGVGDRLDSLTRLNLPLLSG